MATNFTTKNLLEELQNVKNYNSPIEVVYEDFSNLDANWQGIIATVISQDSKFFIKIEQPDNKDNGFSVQDLLDEINDENLLVFIILCNNVLSNNIISHEFHFSNNETTLFLLGMA